ncbi:MAG: hypothetical protein ACRBCL_09710 [Maritimibacter sp.]
MTSNDPPLGFAARQPPAIFGGGEADFGQIWCHCARSSVQKCAQGAYLQRFSLAPQLAID